MAKIRAGAEITVYGTLTEIEATNRIVLSYLDTFGESGSEHHNAGGTRTYLEKLYSDYDVKPCRKNSFVVFLDPKRDKSDIEALIGRQVKVIVKPRLRTLNDRRDCYLNLQYIEPITQPQ